MLNPEEAVAELKKAAELISSFIKDPGAFLGAGARDLSTPGEDTEKVVLERGCGCGCAGPIQIQMDF